MDRNYKVDTATGTVVYVATREGGVDRNTVLKHTNRLLISVATREGGVDRNSLVAVSTSSLTGRHPRGWRG